MSIDAEHLATRLGETVSSTTGADAMGRLADTEYDETGAVLGHEITLRETPHRFTVDGQALYTWCALDTLIFPTETSRLTSRKVPP